MMRYLTVRHVIMAIVGATFAVAVCAGVRSLALLVPWPEWAHVPGSLVFHLARGFFVGSLAVMLGASRSGRHTGIVSTALFAMIATASHIGFVVIIATLAFGPLTWLGAMFLAAEGFFLMIGGSFGRARSLSVSTQRLGAAP